MREVPVLRLPAREQRAPASDDSPSAQTDALASLFAGQLAGLAMLGGLALAFGYFSRSHRLTPVLQVIAGVFMGDEALQEPPAIGPLFSGALAHQLGPSLFWSLVYALFASRFSVWKKPELAVLLGLSVGLLALAVDVLVAVPLVSRHFAGHDVWNESVPAAWSVGSHAIYGLALGWLFPQFPSCLGRGAYWQPL